jgi:thioredoxin 2
MVTMQKPADVKSAEEFQSEVIDYGAGPVVVDFWSHTCPHCTKLNPEFATAAGELDGAVKFLKVAAQDHMDVFREYGVRGTPTLVLFENGKEKARVAGFKTAPEIVAWLQQSI